MNADEYGTALKLFSKLGIDPELDTELSRCFFILSLFYNLPPDERSYHSGSLESKFERRLNKFRIAFFPAFDKEQGCKDVFSIMDSLYNLLLRNNLFEDAYSFFAIFSPWIVADWSTFIGLQPSKKIDGKAQITLIKLLEWCKEFLPEESIFQTDPITLFRSESEISKYWDKVLGFNDDLFPCYWNAVFFHNCPKIEVKVNGNITKTIKTYRRFLAPMTQLLENYWDALKNRNQLKYAANPWQVRANMNHSPIESGLTAEGTLYNTTVFEIINEKATDVIRSAFYSISRNDSELECSFLFEQFAENLSRESRVLIVNPSPDLILKCMSDNRFADLDKLYFSVTDICVAQCYSREIHQAIFIPHADINKLSDIDYVLIMSRDYPANKLDDLLSAINVCKPCAQIIAVLPRQAFESVPSTAEDIWEKQHCYIEKLLRMLVSPLAGWA